MFLVQIGFIFFLHLTSALNRGDSCNTPNNEPASCQSVRECRSLINSVVSKDPEVIKFVKNSNCGYDSQPLVCCGSVGQYSTIPEEISNDKLPQGKSCGVQKSTTNRLFGGTITSIEDFPWMALLRYKYTNGSVLGFQCGGTLINHRYVLTAAHCLTTSSKKFVVDMVRLGEWRISTKLDCEEEDLCSDPVVDVNVEEYIPHSYYSGITNVNDIGLIRMARNVQYTDFIRPICLPPADHPDPPEGTKMTVCGWGTIENGSTSDYKLMVNVPVVNNRKCAEKLNTGKVRIVANHICAGGVKDKDSCRGDSGGPLMGTIRGSGEEHDQWYQEGIVSWGRGCGLQNYPGIYTRVTRYTNWILKNLKS